MAKIQLYRLAALPVEYLARQEALREQMRVDERALKPYREVFITGVCAYQQHAYLDLVRWFHGHAVAQQVAVHQHRLLEFTTGRGRSVEQALDLIEGVLDTRIVSTATPEGEIGIPTVMNVALALLLGSPESPDYAATAARRSAQTRCMQPEIDWRLAHCLVCAREEMKTTFLPMVARLEVAHGSEAVAVLSG